MNHLPLVLRPIPLRPAFAACALALLATAAHADPTFSHPALRGSAATEPGWAQARAAAPRLVGHPASPRWAIVHANADHPAVQVARRAPQPLDPNTFIVQPPATAQWVAPGTEPIDVAVVPRDR